MSATVAAPVLAAAWATLVLVVATRRRPAPARMRALGPAVSAAGGRARRRRATVADVTRAAGRLTLRLVGRPAAATDDERVRRIGGAALAAATAAAVNPWPPMLPAAGAALGWWWPVHRRRRRERQRTDELGAAVPDVVDLFLLAVDAGLTVPLALRAVARRTDGELGAELRRTIGAIDLGRRTADALDDLARPQRAGESVRPLVAALAASERYGAPLATSLVRLADDARRQRRRRAEEAARRLPITLLFPLVTCTLPAFGLLTVGPLIASAARSLRL